MFHLDKHSIQNDSINIVYITDQILDNRENVSTLINLTDTTISLKMKIKHIFLRFYWLVQVNESYR